ncbi:hypothetical protein PR048_008026 [Dryococelus australis]|uniref:Uncharacterized protein n=1 Tax=Dryococelus australis TaxID=614101 RepID=A0ABQ9HWU3_9NEOP|nr:hypothetical protein PR048_008026 [Dryococelus australis]
MLAATLAFLKAWGAFRCTMSALIARGATQLFLDVEQLCIVVDRLRRGRDMMCSSCAPVFGELAAGGSFLCNILLSFRSPNSRGVVDWYATDLLCGRLSVRIPGKAWVLIEVREPTSSTEPLTIQKLNCCVCSGLQPREEAREVNWTRIREDNRLDFKPLCFRIELVLGLQFVQARPGRLLVNRKPLTKGWPNHVQPRQKGRCVLTDAEASKQIAPIQVQAARREHCSPVQGPARSGDGSLDSRGSVTLIPPETLGLKRGTNLKRSKPLKRNEQKRAKREKQATTGIIPTCENPGPIPPRIERPRHLSDLKSTASVSTNEDVFHEKDSYVWNWKRKSVIIEPILVTCRKLECSKVKGSEKIWSTLSSDALRADVVDEVGMEQRRNESVWETGDPRENPPTSVIVRHDSHMRKSGVTRPEIEAGSPWWEASRLTAQPLWPQCSQKMFLNHLNVFFGIQKYFLLHAEQAGKKIVFPRLTCSPNHLAAGRRVFTAISRFLALAFRFYFILTSHLRRLSIHRYEVLLGVNFDTSERQGATQSPTRGGELEARPDCINEVPPQYTPAVISFNFTPHQTNRRIWGLSRKKKKSDIFILHHTPGHCGRRVLPSLTDFELQWRETTTREEKIQHEEILRDPLCGAGLNVKCDEYGAALECKGEGKREITDKTRRPAASSGTILTCDPPGIEGSIEKSVKKTRIDYKQNPKRRDNKILNRLRQTWGGRGLLEKMETTKCGASAAWHSTSKCYVLGHFALPSIHTRTRRRLSTRRKRDKGVEVRKEQCRNRAYVPSRRVMMCRVTDHETFSETTSACATSCEATDDVISRMRTSWIRLRARDDAMSGVRRAISARGGLLAANPGEVLVIRPPPLFRPAEDEFAEHHPEMCCTCETGDFVDTMGAPGRRPICLPAALTKMADNSELRSLNPCDRLAIARRRDYNAAAMQGDSAKGPQPLVHTVFDTSWRTLAQSSPSSATAENQRAVDIGIFVRKDCRHEIRTLARLQKSSKYPRMDYTLAVVAEQMSKQR